MYSFIYLFILLHNLIFHVILQHLKAVQLQIQTVQGKKVLAPGDQVTLHRLYEEQQRILLTGKVVPTIPGQHAVGLPLVSSHFIFFFH